MESLGVSKGSPVGDADGGGVLGACVLLFLREGERDGDELAELVTAFGLTRHRSALPATLAALEEAVLVAVDHRPGVDGVGLRQVYRLTGGGTRWLDERADSLGEPARLVARFVDRYADRTAMQAGDGEHDGSDRPV